MNIHRIIQKCTLVSFALSAFFALSQPLSESKAKPEKFVFLILLDQEPLFIYPKHNVSEYRGLVPEIFSALGRRLNLDISYLPVSRNKIEASLLEGKGDAIWMAPEWISDPSKVIFSKPILKYEEYLYSLEKFRGRDTTTDWFKNKSICLYKDYVYPVIQSFIEQGFTQRVDVSTETSMIHLLLKKRCELIYLGQYRATWDINNLASSPQIFRSPKPLETTSMAIGLAPNRQSLLTSVNEYILELKTSGELEKIMQRHMLKRPVVD